MANAVDLRKGMAILMGDDDLYVVMDRQHVTPGNWRGYVQATLRSIKTGRTVEKRFRSTEEVNIARLEPKKMQFLYSDKDGYHFMDPEYHTEAYPEEVVGDAKNFMTENMEIEILFYKYKAIEIQLPTSVELKVVETIPGIKGDSVTNLQKPATLETGLKLNVPLFIKEGEFIKVDTRTGEYTGRA
ncbi:elongation factor P [Candidatus Auribacterota bacterium]